MSDLQRREHTIEGAGGWRISILELTPSGPVRGVVIAGHAMMVDRRTLVRSGRSSPATSLAAAGLRVFAVDLRGHGRSGPRADEGASWGFDELVDDMTHIVRFVREQAPDRPLTFFGHSLGSLVSLAWLSQHPRADVAAQVCLASEVWRLDHEAHPLRRLAKRALIAGTTAFARAYGRVPARRFRAGSNDESLDYWLDYAGWVRGGQWCSRLRSIDYGADLCGIQCPTLHVVSSGDRLYGRPATALRFSAPLPRREAWHLGHPTVPGPLRGLRPGHMEMVTDPQNSALWAAIGRWLADHCDAAQSPPATS